jgi:hypothetical protein
MSVHPIENNSTGVNNAEANFNTALDNAATRATASAETSSEFSPDEMDQLVSQAMVLGGQFIIMPMAQNMLKEAQEDDE